MSIFSKLFSAGAGSAIEALGTAIDKIVTTDEEKMQAQAFLNIIQQKPQILQAEINKIEAQHRCIFVAGWRPFIGWCCGFGLAYSFFINPILQWITSSPGPELPLPVIYDLVIALLGMGTLRTVEKFGNKTK